MGDITRHIYNMCDGEHSYYNIYDWQALKKKPNGIYIIHHFKNPKHLETFTNLDFPHYNRIISLIHSSHPCNQHPQAVQVITISKSQSIEWANRGIYNKMIRGATEIKHFLEMPTDYKIPVFGRISRWEPGKFHPYWNNFIKLLLKKFNAAYYIMIMSNTPESEKIKHDRAIYVDGIKINQKQVKAANLQPLNIYADAHGEFIDTFNMSLLESMASGLAPVILRGDQSAMVEMIDTAGLIAEDETDFLAKLESLIRSKDLREHYGGLARERAKQYKLKEMIEEWNYLLKKLA